jgi:YHS domain-containing protein
MIKFIILFVVGYVLYRSLKSWVFPAASSSRSVSSETTAKIDDVMIKDPFCEAYFPKRNGVHLNLGGKDLYFCSNQCKDKYLAAHSEKKE